MINIQNIENVSDCVPLYLPHSLYIKPLAKLHISVAVPHQKTGKSISNLMIMEKLSAALKPDKFFLIKVSKSTIDAVRFEAELDDRSRLRSVISRLDNHSFRVTGFNDTFRVRAGESKDDFPTVHDWDSYFRDAKDMDGMKPGERPDTIHFTHLPIRWFCPRHMEQDSDVKPSESIFKRIFEKFGSVRFVDIPICDPYRSKMKKEISGMQTFSFEQDVLFEAYVQFEEYVGFKRAMDEFRGMKLVRKFVDKTQAINIIVNFDKTKHLSDAKIKRRELMVRAEQDKREKVKRLEQEKLEQERKKQEEQRLLELRKQQEKEAKRKEKHLKQLQERGQVEISQKIRLEERRLMISQRKLESIRLLELLFERLVDKYNAANASTHKQYEEAAEIEEKRVRLVSKYKEAAEKLVNEQKEKVKEMKMETPLLGLLKIKQKRNVVGAQSDDNADAETRRLKTVNASLPQMPVLNGFNPFKAATAAAVAAGATATTLHAANDTSNEWVKTVPNMFPYVPTMFPGMPLYRPPGFGMPFNYRGYAPRPRGRGRGRARGRGNFDGSNNSYKQYNYDNDGYDHDDEEEGRYYKSYSRSRNRSRSRSRSRHRYYSKHTDSSSRSRSRSRSHTRSRQRRNRSRSRSHSRSRSWTKTRSHSHSTHRSRSNTSKVATTVTSNRKLASTRRSRSLSSHSSESRSRSRQRTKRAWSRRDSKPQVVLEADELVRSAELIKGTIEKNMQMRMREEKREIKDKFRLNARTDKTTETAIAMSEMNANSNGSERSCERLSGHSRRSNSAVHDSESRMRSKSRDRSRNRSLQRRLRDDEVVFEQEDELVLEAEDKEVLA